MRKNYNSSISVIRPYFWQACPECGQKVYGVAKHSIVSPKEPLMKLIANHTQKIVLLSDPLGERSRMWLVGAVPNPKKFVVNWHWKHKHEAAIFRNRKDATAAIKNWWNKVHEGHIPK